MTFFVRGSAGSPPLSFGLTGSLCHHFLPLKLLFPLLLLPLISPCDFPTAELCYFWHLILVILKLSPISW